MFKWISKWASFRHTSSRWGLFLLLISISFFFLAVFVSSFAIYLSLGGGRWMYYIGLNAILALLIIALVIGIICLAVAMCLAIGWLRKGSEDTTVKDLNTIKREVKAIKRVLNKNINWGKDDRLHTF